MTRRPPRPDCATSLSKRGEVRSSPSPACDPKPALVQSALRRGGRRARRRTGLLGRAKRSGFLRACGRPGEKGDAERATPWRSGTTAPRLERRFSLCAPARISSSSFPALHRERDCRAEGSWVREDSFWRRRIDGGDVTVGARAGKIPNDGSTKERNRTARGGRVSPELYDDLVRPPDYLVSPRHPPRSHPVADRGASDLPRPTGRPTDVARSRAIVMTASRQQPTGRHPHDASLDEAGQILERRLHSGTGIGPADTGGALSARTVTLVPPVTGASVVVTVRVPAKAGSSDSNATASTIFSFGINSTKRPSKMSASASTSAGLHYSPHRRTPCGMVLQRGDRT